MTPWRFESSHRPKHVGSNRDEGVRVVFPAPPVGPWQPAATDPAVTEAVGHSTPLWAMVPPSGLLSFDNAPPDLESALAPTDYAGHEVARAFAGHAEKSVTSLYAKASIEEVAAAVAYLTDECTLSLRMLRSKLPASLPDDTRCQRRPDAGGSSAMGRGPSPRTAALAVLAH
jgi:hypothetical protein